MFRQKNRRWISQDPLCTLQVTEQAETSSQAFTSSSVCTDIISLWFPLFLCHMDAHTCTHQCTHTHRHTHTHTHTQTYKKHTHSHTCTHCTHPHKHTHTHRGRVSWPSYIRTFTFSHLADAIIQSDVHGREQSSYERGSQATTGHPSPLWHASVWLLNYSAAYALKTSILHTHADTTNTNPSSTHSHKDTHMHAQSQTRACTWTHSCGVLEVIDKI